jgi:cytochrome c553
MKQLSIFRKAALTLPFLGAVLAGYQAAEPLPTDLAQLGAQIVAQGTKNGAVACARCHGFDGAADGSGAFPRLDGQSSEYLANQLRAYTSGDRKNALMEPIAKGLNDAEIKAVAQYYATVRATSFVPSLQSSQLLARGQRLAKAGDLNARVEACESCHGPNGKGMPPSVPYLAGQYSDYIRLQFQMYRQGYRKTAQMGDPARNLRDQDVAAVAAYFEQMSRSTSK